MSSENPSYFAIIPANVRYCKNLEPMARLIYGELTALASKEGYCWAFNRYFTEAYDVDERTVRRWLSSLEKEGFIKITYENEITYEGRKIWILPAFSNNNYPPTKMSVPPSKSVRHNNTTNKTSSKDKETTTAAPVLPAGSVVVSSSLQKKIRELPGMTDKLFKKAISSSTEEELQNAYDFAMAPNVIKRIAVFQSALTGKWKKNVEKVNPKQLAMTLFEDDKTYNGAKCQLSPSCIVFYSGSKSDGVSFDDPQFLMKFRKILDSFGIKREF